MPTKTKPAAKKSATKKPAARKPATKKPAATKPAATKPAAKKPAATKPAATKPAAKKPPAEKWGARADKGAPVAGYIAKLEGDQRAIADALVAIISKAVPNATSGLKWGMPMWEVNGQMLTYFRAQKANVRFGLAFVGGVELPDPDGRLEGTGADGKHVKLASPSDVDAALFTRWLKTAAVAR
jgi:hypothetical protein